VRTVSHCLEYAERFRIPRECCRKRTCR